MEYILIDGEGFYKISDCDKLRPFFMSIVSHSDHWMFISSTGGLTAGRRNNKFSLFPYYSDDKISESYETTGSKTIFRVSTPDGIKLWEPHSDRYTGVYDIRRNLYKNEFGNKIIFEEINEDLNLIFRSKWSSSDRFGFIKTSTLVNNSDQAVQLELLDGLQNLLPYGVDPDLQQTSSNLIDAYKKTELIEESGLGLLTLSAIIVDRAEPSEALKANVVWSTGLPKSKKLLSSLQLASFRKGKEITLETDIRAEKGAYFVHSSLELEAKTSSTWYFIADVNKGPSEVINLSEKIKSNEDLITQIEDDIHLGTKDLRQLTFAADGSQLSSDQRKNTRHFANVMFNIMRGGIFDDNYTIEKKDFSDYLSKANHQTFKEVREKLYQMPNTFSLDDLMKVVQETDNKDFRRLGMEYLPLKFSRRHGDPSRPWNKFSINTKSEVDGSKVLDFQGNWRDIFQNWEALAHSYPKFIHGMIFKFLNASTFDGYNPYRVTKDGFDWETIEPDDPWSYIGYWGDHQIIYLLKFLEFIENHYPNQLGSYFSQEIFVYANVPYKIKSYQEILNNPKDTINFDEEEDHQIRIKREKMGADGALLHDASGNIHHVNMMEKLLATVLSKCSNLIPEGGIWMNTQRPEWNDANNALVGNGVSMVTLYYLRRFLVFLDQILKSESFSEIEISDELNNFYKEINKIFGSHQELLDYQISDTQRKSIMDGLGAAGSSYRLSIYQNGFSGEKTSIPKESILLFIKSGLAFLEQSIKANLRADNLYHSYNLLTIESDERATISFLSEMLEGQVAVLSSGYLSSLETVKLLDSLRESKLYRPDQNTYLLYPNRQLPLFVNRNLISQSSFLKSDLLQTLLKDGNLEVIEKDVKGDYHFNGNFNNASSLNQALDRLDKKYQSMVSKERSLMLNIFEEVFNHKAFTGRSGTFYGYEGLGSVYWHMVSKLALAVQECCFKAIESNEKDEVVQKLIDHYYEITEGIGVHKSPEQYGAFPTDPYSHTPGGKGAQQPGMTGQVKEDILTRFGELGIRIKNQEIYFEPRLLRRSEFMDSTSDFKYFDLAGNEQELTLPARSLAFTYCQVPIVYSLASENQIEILDKTGSSQFSPSLNLGKSVSQSLFDRKGEIQKIHVYIKA